MPCCLIAWLAPHSNSSAGLSEVSKTNFSFVRPDSATAGSKFATAVPDVTITATGDCDAFAKPNARKPKPRSSK